MFKVLVADRSPLLRDVLSLSLQTEESLHIVAEAADSEEALGLAAYHRPDVVILDRVLLDERQAGDLVQKLLDRTGSRVVLLDADPSRANARQAAKEFVSAYVYKTTRLRRIVEAVLAVANDRYWTDPALPQPIQDAFNANGSQASSLAELTNRELEVLSCVSRGATNDDVAEQLGITTETVKSHMARIFAKLGVHTRMAAALRFHNSSQASDGVGSS